MKKITICAWAILVFGALSFVSCCKEKCECNDNQNPCPCETDPDNPCIPTKGVKSSINIITGNGPSFSVDLNGDDCKGITSEISIQNGSNYDSIDVMLDEQKIERVYSTPWEKEYDITELAIGTHIYKVTGYSHYMGNVVTTSNNLRFEVLDLNAEPCTPTKETDFTDEVVDNATTHIDISVKGNDCEGIKTNVRLDYNANDFEYWEIFLDGQLQERIENEIQYTTFDNTDLSIGTHSFRFDLHHSGTISSFESSFSITATE